MKTTILKTMDQNFFSKMEEFLWKSLNEFEAKGIRREDLQIFMPDYILRMYQKYVGMMVTYKYSPMDTKFCGVKILDNYQNKVIVSYKDNLLRKDEAFELAIP